MVHLVSSPPQKVDVCGLAQVSGEGGQVGKANTVKNLKACCAPCWVLCGTANPEPPSLLEHLFKCS